MFKLSILFLIGFIIIQSQSAVTSRKAAIKVGDMRFTLDQYRHVFKKNPPGYRKLVSTGILDRPYTELSYRWSKSSDGIIRIPVTFATNNTIRTDKNGFSIGATYTADEKAYVWSSLDTYKNKTCIEFVEWSGEENYIEIFDDTGLCYSSVGRIGGKQKMSLSRPGCFYQPAVAHEFMHALGFQHMFESVDRDTYVSINFANIEAGKEDNFIKVEQALYSTFEVPFDFDSIMMYDKTAFSKNTLPTIVTKTEWIDNIAARYNEVGVAKDLSEKDAQRLNRMYKCSITVTGDTITPGPTINLPTTPTLESRCQNVPLRVSPTEVKTICFLSTPYKFSYEGAKLQCQQFGKKLLEVTEPMKATLISMFSTLANIKIWVNIDGIACANLYQGAFVSNTNCKEQTDFICEDSPLTTTTTPTTTTTTPTTTTTTPTTTTTTPTTTTTTPTTTTTTPTTTTTTRTTTTTKPSTIKPTTKPTTTTTRVSTTKPKCVYTNILQSDGTRTRICVFANPLPYAKAVAACTQLRMKLYQYTTKRRLALVNYLKKFSTTYQPWFSIANSNRCYFISKGVLSSASGSLCLRYRNFFCE